MSYHVASPSEKLAPYIKQYWEVSGCAPLNNAYTQRIIPSGLPELMIFSGHLPDVSITDKRFESNVILSGQQKGFYDLNIRDSFSLFSVTFQPHGMMMFFDLPMSELTDCNVPLQFILKKETARLEDSIVGAESFKEKVTLAEEFLLHRLRRNLQKYEFNRIHNCVSIITREKGISNINQLASNACLSRKQFERIFSESIGASPHQFLKIVRFQSAIYHKAHNQGCNFTSLAYNCGYYDQSHMNNEFRKMSGLTPREFFAGGEPVSDFFE
jgi:AraC-like DNA-binding protein